MLKNYLRIAYRNLTKNKVFSSINILGLAVGMAVCLLILQYVSFELNYDGFHEHADRIYRVALHKYQENGNDLEIATNYNALPLALRKDLPEVDLTTHFHSPTQGGNWVFSRQDTKGLVQFDEKKIFYADEFFLQIFSFGMVAGDAVTALKEPYSIVLTASAAQKYFGNDWTGTDVIGQTIRVSSVLGDHEHKITGIVKDVPPNSHLQFDLLLSANTFDDLYPEEQFATNWQWYDTYVYLLAKPGVTEEQIQRKLPDFLSHYSEEIGEGKKVKSKLILQPLEDIHLYSHLVQEASVNGSYKQVYFLTAVAILLIVLACLNYINLTTAQSLTRVKEVGIRKFIGASKSQLIQQSLTETLLLNSIAVCLALTFALPVTPFISELTGIEINVFSYADFFPFLLVIFAGTTLLSCAYPAYFIVSFQPVQAIKGKASGKTNVSYVRNSLVVFQFMVSTLVICFTLLVYQQYQFMTSQSLGFDDQVLIVNTPAVRTTKGSPEYATKLKTFKNQLLSDINIQSVTASTQIPGTDLIWSTSKISREGQGDEAGIDMNFIGVDHNYIETLGLQILAGQNFPIEPNYKEDPYILNESAMKALGFKDPEEAIHQYVVHHDKKHEIVAVVNDYHQRSLREPFVPLAFGNYPYHNEFFALKIASQNVSQTIEAIQNTYEEIFPENPFVYFFLDALFDQQYQSDVRFSRMFSIFSIIVILIAGLGLFGLSSYTAIQRTKEISIRKVLGASVHDIVALLSQDFLKLVLLASLLALPVAYSVMRQWLENYAFRIEISWWLLAVPVAMILLVAFLTVSLQTVKAALADPVDSLRCE